MILQLKTETSPGVFIYKPLDVFEDFEVTYNHQFEDYKTIAGRKIPYTNKFKIPTTPNNRTLCGLPIDANYPASRDVDGKMYYSNGLIAFDFIASIEGQQIDTLQPYIEISVIDIISHALKELNKWKMSDLFADANNTQRRYVDLDIDTWVYGGGLSANDSLDEMFTFPFYNFNNKTVMFSHDPMRKLNQLQPTFTLWKLIQNIFSFAGISVESDFLRLDNQLYPGIKANELGLTIPVELMTNDSYSWSADSRFLGIGRTPLITQARSAGVPNQFPTSPSLNPIDFMVSDLSNEAMKFNYDSIGDKYEDTSPFTPEALIIIRAEENNGTAGSFCSTVSGKGKIVLDKRALETDDVFFHINQLNKEESPLNNNGIPTETHNAHVLYPNQLLPGITVPDMDVRMVISDTMEPVTGYWYEQGWTNTGSSYNVNESVICGNAVYVGIDPPIAGGFGTDITDDFRSGLKFRIDFNTSTEMFLDLEANKRINITFILVPKNETTVTIDAEWHNWYYTEPSPTAYSVRTEITQGYIKHSYITTPVDSAFDDVNLVEAKYDWSVTPSNDPQGFDYIFPVTLAMDFVKETAIPTGFVSGTSSDTTLINKALVDMSATMKSVKDYKLIDVVKMVSQRFNLKFYSTSDGVIHLDTNKNRLSGISYNIDHLTDTGVAVEFTDNEIGIVNIKDSNPSFYEKDFNRLDNDIVSDIKRDEVSLTFTSSIVNDKMFKDEYDDSSFGLLATGLSSNYFGVSDREQAPASKLKPVFTFLKEGYNELWFPVNDCSISLYNYADDYLEPQLDAAFYNYFTKGNYSALQEAVNVHDTGFKLVSFVEDTAPIEPRNLYMQTWFQNIMDRVNDESVILSPDLYVSEATLKHLMDFPTLLYKGAEWEYQGLNSYPLSNKKGGMTSVKLIKKQLWVRDGVPTMPLNHIVTVNLEGTIETSWDASTDDIGVTGYKLYLDGYYVATVSNAVFTRIYTDMVINQFYYIGVSAIDSSGNESEINWMYEEAKPDTEAPGNPTNLTYTNLSCDGVTMSWVAPTDNVAVTDYNIYDGGVVIATVTAPTQSYTYTGYAPSTFIETGVSALDAAGNESSRTAGNQTTSASCPLTAPTGLVITGVTDTTLTFAWDASLTLEVDAYRVTLDGVLVATIASPENYTFTGLTQGTFYTLGVSYVITGVETSPESTITGVTNSSTAFTASTDYTTQLLACDATDTTLTYTHSGNTQLPKVGNKVYYVGGVNDGLAVVAGFYQNSAGGVFEVNNSNGGVLSLSLCA